MNNNKNQSLKYLIICVMIMLFFTGCNKPKKIALKDKPEKIALNIPREVVISFISFIKESEYQKAINLIAEKNKNEPGYKKKILKSMKLFNKTTKEKGLISYNVKNVVNASGRTNEEKIIKYKIVTMVLVFKKPIWSKSNIRRKNLNKTEIFFYINKINGRWKITATPFEMFGK